MLAAVRFSLASRARPAARHGSTAAGAWVRGACAGQLGAIRAHASPSDVQRAEAYYREALTLAKRLGMRPLQAHCYLGLGTLYAKIGQREKGHLQEAK